LSTYRDIKGHLQALYSRDKKPWLVGFSGGKDSEGLLTSGNERMEQLIEFCEALQFYRDPANDMSRTESGVALAA
jgi:3'-phosphoadenosine 5'-phosphosulfate sulfotransferase (PAPS reductase)/FAD synthetase